MRISQYFNVEALPPKPTNTCCSSNVSTTSCNTYKSTLKSAYSTRKQAATDQFESNGGLKDDLLSDRINALRQKSDALATVRKDRVFDSQVTEEEASIIQQRVHLQQLQFQEYEKREVLERVSRIHFLFDYMTLQEIETGLEESQGDEETTLINFTNASFLMRIRKRIASKNTVQLTQSQAVAYQTLLDRRKTLANKTTHADDKIRLIQYSSLKVDEAIEQLARGEDPAKVFEGWSEARIKAYRQIHTKPNVYYYRFNKPGEKQENGAWRPEERSLFFERIQEFGTNGQWGIFSKEIPGRVGYQCSNYYRQLLKSGEIADPNYTRDEQGDLHYLFGKKEGKEGVIRTHRKHGTIGGTYYERKKKRLEEEELEKVLEPGDTPEIIEAKSLALKSKKRKNALIVSAVSTLTEPGESPKLEAKPKKLGSKESKPFKDLESMETVKPAKKRKLKEMPTPQPRKLRKEDIFIDADDSGTFEGKKSYMSDQEEESNPLPGFIDPITLEEVIKPAISPYGHVMGYDVWLRCLSDRKNVCPMTKKPLYKRELVLLTSDNIHAY